MENAYNHVENTLAAEREKSAEMRALLLKINRGNCAYIENGPMFEEVSAILQKYPANG